MCLLGWMKRGIHARADRRAARRVITPSHSAPICPSSCPNTQTSRPAPHIKEPEPDGRLGSGSVQHRGRLCHQAAREKNSGAQIQLWSSWKAPWDFYTLIWWHRERDSRNSKNSTQTHTHWSTLSHWVWTAWDLHNESFGKCVHRGEFSIRWTVGSHTDLQKLVMFLSSYRRWWSGLWKVSLVDTATLTVVRLCQQC